MVDIYDGTTTPYMDEGTTTPYMDEGTGFRVRRYTAQRYTEQKTDYHYDLKSLQKHISEIAKKKSITNLKNGWQSSNTRIQKEYRVHKIKHVIRNLLPVKIRENEAVRL